ncbi:MAG: condensation domain-containing protein, partial [Candidatus Cybelea sp.]
FEHRARLDAYLAALQVVIDRHDILRTAVLWEGLREPVQVVWRRAPLSVEEIVVGEGEDAVAALSARFDLQTYRLDVGRAPIMHAVISFDGHRNTWILMLFRHHVTGDHVTVELIHEEIRSRLAGEGALLPPSVPFRNFIAHARLSVHRDADEAYFRGLLGDVDWPTAPFGLLNVHRDGAAIREAKQYLQPPLSQKLRARARGTGVSAASLCHLAWGLVLSRLTGQDDVVFGTVLFGRMQGGESADRAMGLFMNTLPVRICIDERALDRAVAETHAQLASSLMHEHASLTLAQRCSAVPAPKPLFSTLFNYRHIARASDSERDIGDWDGTTVVEGQERTNYPITLSFNDYGDDFSFSAQVDPLVDPSRICSFMLTAISEIIEALESAPSSLLRNVNAIPAAELSTVLRDWNSTDKTYPRGRCVHELFEANAESSPDAVAVTGADTSITYAELNDRANRLARFLYNRGIGPSSRVAIIGPPSVATIAARLATLKTGAAYVCVPRSSSSDWTRRILLHSRAEVILADGRIKSPPGEVEELPAGKPLDLHADAALWENEPTSNLSRPQLTSQLLALVQYQIQKGDATPVSDHANHIQEHVFRNK